MTLLSVGRSGIGRKRGISDMALKRVEKTGVYRYPDGSSVYLTEGSNVDERVLDGAKLDAKASGAWNVEPERNYFGAVQDAPQDQSAEETWSDKRAVPGAPENKAMPPAEQRTDAELADAAAKGKRS